LNTRISKGEKALHACKIFFLGLSALIGLFPFYLVVMYAIKSPIDAANTNPLLPPHTIAWSNFTEAIEASNFFNASKNSLIVSLSCVVLTILVCSMAAYAIARSTSRLYRILFYMFVASIMMPFQAIMFPLYKTWLDLGLLNTLPGLVLALLGVGIGYNIFLYTGFIKTVPRELEEAAMIDGASKYRTFFGIVFPLLKPVTMTVLVLGTLGAWNDFVVSMVIVQKEAVTTLPLTQVRFFGEYTTQLHLAFAGVLLAMVPVIILYFFTQKYIVGGVTAGAVKG
jgi:raffinose/stachyose/melibiose transport system permease protein